MKYALALSALLIWTNIYGASELISPYELKIIMTQEPFKIRQQKLIKLRHDFMKSWLSQTGYNPNSRIKQFRNIIHNYLKFQTGHQYKRAQSVQYDVNKLSTWIKQGGEMIRFTKRVNQVLKSHCQDIATLVHLRDWYNTRKPNEEDYWITINQRIEQLKSEKKCPAYAKPHSFPSDFYA